MPRSRVQASPGNEEVQPIPQTTAPDGSAGLAGRPPVAAPAPAPPKRRHLFIAHLRRWLAEIIIVFLGVYAAFLLNRWQSQQQDRLAHRQILQSLAEETSRAITAGRREAGDSQRSFDALERQFQTGEMPELRLKGFATDYDPADDVILSETGAERLLDYKTLRALRRVSSLDRQGTMLMRNRQELSFELIAPLLGAPKEAFYDPQTRQLKTKFDWYREDERRINQFMQDDLRAHEELLAQIQAEQESLK